VILSFQGACILCEFIRRRLPWPGWALHGRNRWEKPCITSVFDHFTREITRVPITFEVSYQKKKQTNKSGTTPYSRGASASAPPKGRKEGGQRRAISYLEYLGGIAMTVATIVGMHSTVEVYVLMS
jgi:hypothetical protein